MLYLTVDSGSVVGLFDATVERVQAFNLLGVYNTFQLIYAGIHIDHTVTKATGRLYFLKQLKRAGLPPSHLLHFYSASE